ncbi:MAG: phosphoribosylformylglycinamidine cyclo-ligase [Spirochaetaceae bacterium]|nr:phosphoribosylformylglycinamidine cyclo-ligase [Spirochaetaceae bacterium]
MGISYQESGVDTAEAAKAVARYRELAEKTPRSGALNGIGSFAGMFSLKTLLAAGKGMQEPVLVAGADGVGTKLDIAFRMGVYHTIGIDCVAMCANDILCHGAKPLFFLDYLACGKLDAAIAERIVSGVAEGCRETGMTLLGGETAEMPGFYDPGKYDIAGFAVGIADRNALVDGAKIQNGDALVGIASSGVHSNGFSLIRRVIPNVQEDFGGKAVGMTLLEPTRLYVKPVLGLMEQVEVRGMAHITGGGWYENIPRMFAVPKNIIIEESWEIPRIFARIAQGVAGLPPKDEPDLRELLKSDRDLKKTMFGAFNMGVGFVLAVPPADCSRAIAYLAECGHTAYRLGRIEAGSGEVCFA